MRKMALVAQMPGYLANALERCFKKFFINHAHRVRFEGCLPFWFKVKRRRRDRRQGALLADRKGPMVRVNHPEPRIAPQGLSSRDKRSFAAASSQILACSSFTATSLDSWVVVFRTPLRPRFRIEMCIPSVNRAQCPRPASPLGLYTLHSYQT